MTTLAKILISCTALALPFAASAQSNDAKYCQALTETYRNSVPKTATPDAVVPVAISKCASGDTATGIPVLEKALTDAKVSLPPRT
jgi:hypothetical protein